MANRKEMVIVKLNSGCLLQTSHKLKSDGYFRKRVWHNGSLRLMMYHRYMWIQKHGEIPKGYEVDHKCKNRACFNVDHLQLLKASDHRTKDNTGRHGDKKQAAYLIWKQHCGIITGAALAELVGVSFSATCKWIREWKADERQ